ncbi:MAG TPA: acyl carrier protein [Magnetospirillum sp.]|nr:acyl carrier protein [Magnetospirillum sp.]
MDQISTLSEKTGLSRGETQSALDAVTMIIRRVKPSLTNTEFHHDTRFDALGIDSLHLITILFEIEEYFGISIVDRNLDDVVSVGEACETVCRLVAEKRLAEGRA